MTPRSHTDRPIRVLLQTTIPPTPDDWHIGRFSLLKAHLASLMSPQRLPMYDIVARDRSGAADDQVLSSLDASDFDELWLFAVDTGDGLSDRDGLGIDRFRARGGGLLIARDHQDLGCSVCKLGAVGAAHHFHTMNPERPHVTSWTIRRRRPLRGRTTIPATTVTSSASTSSERSVPS
jgi:hypothetical protein